MFEQTTFRQVPRCLLIYLFSKSNLQGTRHSRVIRADCDHFNVCVVLIMFVHMLYVCMYTHFLFD